MKPLSGIIHGKFIELKENLGLPDGEEVEIQVTAKRKHQPGDGLRRCAGALAEDTAWDAIMEEVQQARHLERPLAGESA